LAHLFCKTLTATSVTTSQSLAARVANTSNLNTILSLVTAKASNYCLNKQARKPTVVTAHPFTYWMPRAKARACRDTAKQN